MKTGSCQFIDFPSAALTRVTPSKSVVLETVGTCSEDCNFNSLLGVPFRFVPIQCQLEPLGADGSHDTCSSSRDFFLI